MPTKRYSAVQAALIEWFAYQDMRAEGYNPYDTSPFFMTVLREVEQGISNEWPNAAIV